MAVAIGWMSPGSACSSIQISERRRQAVVVTPFQPDQRMQFHRRASRPGRAARGLERGSPDSFALVGDADGDRQVGDRPGPVGAVRSSRGGSRRGRTGPGPPGGPVAPVVPVPPGEPSTPGGAGRADAVVDGAVLRSTAWQHLFVGRAGRGRRDRGGERSGRRRRRSRPRSVAGRVAVVAVDAVVPGRPGDVRVGALLTGGPCDWGPAGPGNPGLPSQP